MTDLRERLLEAVRPGEDGSTHEEIVDRVLAVIHRRTAAPSGFMVNPELVRDILAAVAFLYYDSIPEEVCDQLNAPSDRMLSALNELVGIRQEASHAA